MTNANSTNYISESPLNTSEHWRRQFRAAFEAAGEVAMIPREILAEEDIKTVHQTSMEILERIGVEFLSKRALAVFDYHGIRVEDSRVYFTEQQIWDALKSAPDKFVLHARNPERNVLIGRGRPIFAPGYGAPFLVDMLGDPQEPTLDDYRDLVKVVHGLPNQDVSGHLLTVPSDIPAERVHLFMLLEHMKNSDKPFLGNVGSQLGVRHTMDMINILFGGDAAGGRTVTMGLVNSLTPLTYGDQMMYALIRYAEANQAVLLSSLAMGGSTAPITLAGLLALQNAELLSAVVLTQLVRPGSPVVYGTASACMEMSKGLLAIGGPEMARAATAHMQLARFYGLPARGSGAVTDSNMPDMQAGFESMQGMMGVANSGADLILHSAGILSSYMAMSREKMVLDDEICGLVRWLVKPVVVDEETLAYDSIARIGPGGNFLTEDLTVERCQTEFWMPNVANRCDRESWIQDGKPELIQQANYRWKQLVDEHEPPPLDGLTLRQLEQFVNVRWCKSCRSCKVGCR